MAPLKYPDTVRIGARVSEIGEDRFVMDYCVVSEALGRVAAKGQGLIVAYDYNKGEKAPLPAEARKRIEALESSNRRP
jgi:acyl-CoA thioester hydrolase